MTVSLQWFAVSARAEDDPSYCCSTPMPSSRHQIRLLQKATHRWRCRTGIPTNTFMHAFMYSYIGIYDKLTTILLMFTGMYAYIYTDAIYSDSRSHICARISIIQSDVITDQPTFCSGVRMSPTTGLNSRHGSKM